MVAFTAFAALAAAAAQQAPSAPPPEAVAPHQQQVDTILPSPQPSSQASAPPAQKPRGHKRLHVGKAAVARASRVAGGAVAGPAGAALAPVLVDRAGHKVKKLVRHKRHGKPPAHA
jgi:hypothetical protein